MENEPLPQYMRIAVDLASRIADGALEEGQRISGRSLLSSEYSVSPETVRKAVRLLADMKVVEVQDKRGIFILSADNARRYVQSMTDRREQQCLREELRELLEQYAGLGKRMFAVAEQLVEARATPLPPDRCLPNYEVRLSPDSDKIGKSLGSLRFWQSTGATVVAIRRGKNTILSPGPYAELYGGDEIVFVGAPDSMETVQRFLNSPVLDGAAGEG